MTKTIRCAIALIITITYCGLAVTGHIGVEGISAIAMYVVKKFMDSLKEEKE